jgi:hypothetical protein
VGRSANSWRTAQAWVQGRRVDGLQVHNATPRTAIADLADIPEQSRGPIVAIDLCVVPTLTFERLFAFLVLGHGRRQLLWLR